MLIFFHGGCYLPTWHCVCGVFDLGFFWHISIIDVTCVVGVTGVASTIFGD
jgi:hypothetical protein